MTRVALVGFTRAASFEAVIAQALGLSAADVRVFDSGSSADMVDAGKFLIQGRNESGLPDAANGSLVLAEGFPADQLKRARNLASRVDRMKLVEDRPDFPAAASVESVATWFSTGQWVAEMTNDVVVEDFDFDLDDEPALPIPGGADRPMPSRFDNDGSIVRHDEPPLPGAAPARQVGSLLTIPDDEDFDDFDDEPALPMPVASVTPPAPSAPVLVDADDDFDDEPALPMPVAPSVSRFADEEDDFVLPAPVVTPQQAAPAPAAAPAAAKPAPAPVRLSMSIFDDEDDEPAPAKPAPAPAPVVTPEPVVQRQAAPAPVKPAPAPSATEEDFDLDDEPVLVVPPVAPRPAPEPVAQEVDEDDFDDEPDLPVPAPAPAPVAQPVVPAQRQTQAAPVVEDVDLDDFDDEPALPMPSAAPMASQPAPGPAPRRREQAVPPRPQRQEPVAPVVEDSVETPVGRKLSDVFVPDPEVPEAAPFMQSLSPVERRQQSTAMELRRNYGSLEGVRPRSATSAALFFITGTRGGVGKTTIAWIMANVAAQTQKGLEDPAKVYLIEGDYKNPKLANRLKLEDGLDSGHYAQFLERVQQRSSNSAMAGDSIAQRNVRTIEECVYTDPESGLNIVAAPYDLTKNSHKWVQVAISRIVEWATNQGGYVFIDAGTLTNAEIFDRNTSSKAHHVVLVSYPQEPEVERPEDDTNIQDIQRAGRTLTGRIDELGLGVSPERVRVFFNHSSYDEYNVTKEHIYPYATAGFLPKIVEIDRRWIGNVASESVQMGVRQVAQALASMEPIEGLEGPSNYQMVSAGSTGGFMRAVRKIFRIRE